MVRRAYPVRTCVGCRKRAPASQLLRVVVRIDGDQRVAVPDPSRRLPGRGAHLHVQPDCLDQAVRRRAFARALRAEGVIVNDVLAAYVREHEHGHATGEGGAPESPSRPAR